MAEDPYRSPDKWKPASGDFHPLIEQRFQRIEEDLDAMRNFMKPFIEREMAELRQEIKELKQNVKK